ncbi:hypothetical protein LXA43DRAFT_1141822, partial [Ganoderma leucocontextum]
MYYGGIYLERPYLSGVVPGTSDDPCLRFSLFACSRALPIYPLAYSTEMDSQFAQKTYLYTADKAGVWGSLTVSASQNDPAAGGDCPDLILISSDEAFYYVHRPQIACISKNSFAGLLLDNLNTSITLPEPASVFDLLVRIVYGIPCTHLAPSLETTEATLEALIKYGIPPRLHAFPSQPLYHLLLLHAPHRPIDAYAVAGRHGLEDAAVVISGHLLVYDTSLLSDALVAKMGPVYFCRLLCLHRNRLSALKNIVLRPLAQHSPMPACAESAPARAQLARAWAFAVAQLVWDASPGVSTDALKRMFESAGTSCVACEPCHATLETRIGEVCEAWAAVKVRTV